MHKLEEHFKAILAAVDNPNREGLRDTPKRFIKFFTEFCDAPPIKWNDFDSEGYDDMIVEDAIPFASLCEHHGLCFRGHAYIGYIPSTRIAGLSKLPRTVNHFAAGLQNQERLTRQIANFLQMKLKPKGIAVVLRAEHTCMSIRGVKAHGVNTTTLCMLGAFRKDPATRAEFMAQLPLLKA
jgi:GTP cyclohydrolase I